MKSWFRITAFGLAAVLWSCTALAGAGANYKLVVLGDLHFDGNAYHQTVPTRSFQLEERNRNLAMWQGSSQALLKDAAKRLDENVPFVIQQGDITQGDCDTVALHERMFRDAYSTVKGLLNGHRFLGVKGNHDVRLARGESAEAANNAYLPLLAKEANLPELKTGNYAVMQGPDLFLFIDSHGTPKDSVSGFVEKELKAHPDTRYVFLVTHLPLLPVSLGAPDWMATDHVAVRDLLMTRRAVVLAGHTHVFSHAVYRDGAGRTLPQLVTTSMGCSWKPGEAIKARQKGYKQYRKRLKKQEKPYRFWAEYPEGCFTEHVIYSNLAGYTVLEVNDDGVTARIFTGNPEASLTIPLLSKKPDTGGSSQGERSR